MKKIMILTLLLVSLFLVACSSETETLEIQVEPFNLYEKQFTLLPVWLEDKIDAQVVSVYKCKYHDNQSIYVFSMTCCDLFEPVYDKSGKLICSLGGFSGAGDGKCTDIKDYTHTCNLLWKKN